MAKEPPTGEIKLDVSTRLAFERTRVSYDRTMMAWVRTAISLITFGFSIYKFFQIEQAAGFRDNRAIGPREFALIMVCAGLVSLVIGTLEHWRNLGRLRLEYPGMPRSRVSVLGLLVSALGIMALAAVVLRQ